MNRKAWNKAFSLLLAIAMVVGMCTGFVKSERTAEAAAAGVSYTTHVQKKGWMSYSSNGVTSGTSGQGLRLEALKVKLTNANYSGNIEYRAYCQTYAWTNWTKNDGLAGTSGEGKRMEAVQIKLTGQMANHYDVYYRVHSQTYGWLGWAKNGETAGTSDYAKRLEAIQIKLVAKNAAAPGTTANHYVHPMVKYRTHVQSYGWQGYVMDGAMSGTSGQAKRLEAINIALTNQEYSGNITYRTHVQTYGWQSWKSNGALSGTSGQAKRLEAIEIKLTGEMANKYDVYYRVHAQKFGWLGWAKNGASAGTSGYGYRLEGIEIKLVNKGAAAPGTTANPYYAKQTTAKPTEKPTEKVTEKPTEAPTTVHTHDYNSSVTKQPTCTDTGIRTYTCSCGDSYTKSIPATGHNWEHHDAVYETATKVIKEAYDEPVYEERMVCNGCGAIFSGDSAGADAAGEHIMAADFYGPCQNYSSKYVQAGTIHHDAVTETYQKLESSAYDVCKTCGARK